MLVNKQNLKAVSSKSPNGILWLYPLTSVHRPSGLIFYLETSAPTWLSQATHSCSGDCHGDSRERKGSPCFADFRSSVAAAQSQEKGLTFN